MTKAKLATGCATVLAALAMAGQAMAAWPPSAVGTWTMQANQSGLVLTITSQGGPGDCKAIAGTLVDVVNGGNSNNIQGFYCPHSGRVQFLRKDVTTNDTFQVYTGNLSFLGATTYMAGVFAEDNARGLLGEYSFSASR